MTAPIPASFNVDKGLDGILVIPINGSLVTAGNSDAVDIKLENRYVSRRHFRVRLDHDVFYISDLGSRHGNRYSFKRGPKEPIGRAFHILGSPGRSRDPASQQIGAYPGSDRETGCQRCESRNCLVGRDHLF